MDSPVRESEPMALDDQSRSRSRTPHSRRTRSPSQSVDRRRSDDRGDRSPGRNGRYRSRSRGRTLSRTPSRSRSRSRTRSRTRSRSDSRGRSYSREGGRSRSRTRSLTPPAKSTKVRRHISQSVLENPETSSLRQSADQGHCIDRCGAPDEKRERGPPLRDIRTVWRN